MLVRIEEARSKAQERVSYLEQITEKLRALDRMKTEFVERTSHQLRTPLNRIKWGLQSLYDEGSLPKDQKQFVANMLESSEDLIELSGELLEIQRLEEGREVYESKVIAIAPIVEEVLSGYSEEMKTKDISLDIQKGENRKVIADKGVLELVFRNIIDNAVIYNKDGGSITIRFAKSGESLVVSVRDTGIGIPEKEIPFIFKRFYRAKNAARYVADGIGLGLALSKKALEGQGGSISIRSKEGEWTEVSVALPSFREKTTSAK